MRYKTRPGFLTIKEAAVRYQVSRAKLHRLVRAGRVHSEKDPRDERATLLRTEEPGGVFRVPPGRGRSDAVRNGSRWVEISLPGA